MGSRKLFKKLFNHDVFKVEQATNVRTGEFHGTLTKPSQTLTKPTERLTKPFHWVRKYFIHGVNKWGCFPYYYVMVSDEVVDQGAFKTIVFCTLLSYLSYLRSKSVSQIFQEDGLNSEKNFQTCVVIL